jgi:hypothetical protein
MASKDVVEVIYGKHAKYEVVRIPGGFLTSTEYVIYKNGEYHRGTFKSLAEAVSAARKEG